MANNLVDLQVADEREERKRNLEEEKERLQLQQQNVIEKNIMKKLEGMGLSGN